MGESAASGTELDITEAVALLTAQIQYWANLEAVDLLVIKGPIATLLGARPRRPSADVDVLVRPGHEIRIAERLCAHGWKLRPHDDSPGFPRHSESYYHPDWPTDIDVHFRFPGFGGTETDVFNVLWGRRRINILAGQSITSPDATSAFVIQALHGLRSPWNPVHQGDLEHLRNQASQLSWTGIIELAHQTSCLGELAPLLQLVNPSQVEQEFPGPSEEWKRRSEAQFPGVARIRAISRVPWHRRPSAIFRVLYPSRESLAIRDIALREASEMRLLKERWRRLRRGLGYWIRRH